MTYRQFKKICKISSNIESWSYKNKTYTYLQKLEITK